MADSSLPASIHPVDSFRDSPVRRLAGVSPSRAAEVELAWFFNEAESEADMPSSYCMLLAGRSPGGLEESERRAEALHAARKIEARLQRLTRTSVVLLAGLYTERARPAAVTRALPDGLAGAAEASARIRLEHLRALAREETFARSLTVWIEEVVRSGPPGLLAAWRKELERTAALAVSAYEHARGRGPSVVPVEREEEEGNAR
ncbi:MAG TPA: hypothetical protein VHS09_13465 [Polyangiaceae bacterium]|nr:hypothetical protein [Polyangiaceae bacterium]